MEHQAATQGTSWRAERAKGMLGIFAATLSSAALWYWIRLNAPILDGMDEPVARFAFALKCGALAVLFTLVLGVEAVAHERLVSPAFDPLAGHETKRMRVNQRYLQNTLEQTVVFLVGLLGQLVLGYVGLRVGADVAGAAGAWAVLVAFLLFEALLFWTTRAR